MIQLKINSPATVMEGESYPVKLRVTNQSFKAGVPAEAMLRVGISAGTEWVILISPQVSSEYFAPNETVEFSFPMPVPIGAGGQTGLITAWIEDPAGGMLASATEDLTITTPVYPSGLTILGVTAERGTDGSITVHIEWVHKGVNWGYPRGHLEDFFVAGAYFGDAENNVWGLYREVTGSGTEENIPIITDIYFPWDFLTGMGGYPEGAYEYHDFNCRITLHKTWEIWVKSTQYIAIGVI